MKTVKYSLAALMMTAMPLNTSAQQDVEIVTEHMGGNIYMLVGQGGNIGASVGEEGIVLVDDQFAPLTDKILAALAEISDAPVRFVINTHFHGDHTGGNENLGNKGTIIVAHDNVYERLHASQMEAMTKGEREAFSGLPMVTFDHALSFRLNGDNARAIHVENAHTDGDSIIYFQNADVLHMGDVFFNGRYPYIDVDSGGDVDGFIAAVERALDLVGEGTKIIPGHGPAATRDDLVAYHNMLVTLRDRIGAMKADGQTLEAVLASGVSADYDADWTWQFINPERIITAIYRSVG